ncbi:hypothetical protein vseg_008671 [Gypsophila vaccaria]
MAELPLEIITEILCRLPPKPLIRFKTVSKQWNSLITSPNFIKRHLSQTLISNSSNPNHRLVVSHYSIVTAAAATADIRFSAVVDHPLRHLPHRPAVELIESCHGVLLISDYNKDHLFLFNPATNKHRLVPPAPSNGPTPKPGRGSGFVEVFGFGYDGCVDDYKVVRLLQWPSQVNARFRSEVSVYSLRKSSWNLIKDGSTSLSSSMSLPTHFVQHTNAVYAKEMLHFVVVDGEFKPMLSCFDLRTETFSIVNYPEMESNNVGKMTMSLRGLNGCLCLLVSHQRYRVDPRKAVGDPLYNRRFLYADVWEMRERGRSESWAKLFRIRKSEIGEPCMYLRLITYSKDKGSVLVEVDGVWFGWYDLVARKMRKVTVHGLRVEDSAHMAFTYVESLVSVAVDQEGSKAETLAKKAVKKNDFLSSGFKLRL